MSASFHPCSTCISTWQTHKHTRSDFTQMGSSTQGVQNLQQGFGGPGWGSQRWSPLETKQSVWNYAPRQSHGVSRFLSLPFLGKPSKEVTPQVLAKHWGLPSCTPHLQSVGVPVLRSPPTLQSLHSPDRWGPLVPYTPSRTSPPMLTWGSACLLPGKRGRQGCPFLCSSLFPAGRRRKRRRRKSPKPQQDAIAPGCADKGGSRLAREKEEGQEEGGGCTSRASPRRLLSPQLQEGVQPGGSQRCGTGARRPTRDATSFRLYKILLTR